LISLGPRFKNQGMSCAYSVDKMKRSGIYQLIMIYGIEWPEIVRFCCKNIDPCHVCNELAAKIAVVKKCSFIP
jgi:hypothetical protein